MPSHSNTLVHGFVQTKVLAMSSQNLSGSALNFELSAAQSFSSACCLTISGAAYSSTMGFAVSGTSGILTTVLIEKLLTATSYELPNDRGSKSGTLGHR